MTSQLFFRRFFLLHSVLSLASLAFATDPTVTVISPVNGSSDVSPVHFVASASSPECVQGIAAIRIYMAPQKPVYTIQSSQLDTSVPLSPGTYNTVIQAWDNCGGVGKTAVNITVSASGLQPPRFLYVADFGNNKILSFKVDPSTGALSATGQGPVSTNSSIRLATDKGGYRLYLTNAGPVPFARVYGYFIDRRNGFLKPVPGSPLAVDASPGSLAVHPSGKFVFIGSLFLGPGEGILVLKVETDGSLTPVNTTPIPTTSTPGSIVVDRWGKYLYVGSQGGDSIDAFEINGDSGALTPLPGSPYIVSTPGCGDPSLAALSDWFGRFLYAADGSSYVSAYAIAGRVGTLSELAKSPFPVDGGCAHVTDSPRNIATEPGGRFLYVMNGQSISIFSINAGNGSLKHVGDTPRIDGQYFGPLRADPSGKFLYVGRASDGPPNEVVGFSIDQVSGRLTLLPGSPFVMGKTVEVFDLAVTP